MEEKLQHEGGHPDVKDTAKGLDGQEETVLREMKIKLSRLLFNWIGCNFYEQVIKGEYNGYTDE